MGRKFVFAAILAAAVAGLGGVSKADNAGPRVLVIPFTTLNVPDDQRWIAKAVQEDVVSDLGRVGGYTPVTSDAQVVVEDNATAVRIGKQANAAFVVRGAVQQIDQTVRLTGQLIDTNTGDTVQSASVTGPLPQLLRLEDELASQLRGASPVVTGDTQVAPTQPVTATSTLAPAAPTVQVVYMPVQTQTPVYYPPYDYTDYSSYYPGFYGSPIIYLSSGFGFNRGFCFNNSYNSGFSFRFSGRGGSVGGAGGFNQFHSPRVVTTGAFVTQPAFSSRSAFNSTPSFSSRSAFSATPSFSRGGFSGGGGGSFGHSSFSGGGGFHR